MADVTITPYDHGPYVISGDVRVVDAQGNELKAPGQAIALCRCGASANKPWCDGTHSKVGFQSEIKGS